MRDLSTSFLKTYVRFSANGRFVFHYFVSYEVVDGEINVCFFKKYRYATSNCPGYECYRPGYAKCTNDDDENDDDEPDDDDDEPGDDDDTRDDNGGCCEPQGGYPEN